LILGEDPSHVVYSWKGYLKGRMKERLMDLTQVSLIILAGGKSLRMGTNKAHLSWDAMRFIDVLAEKGKQLGFGEIILSGYEGTIDGCRTVPDLLSNRGPLGGIYTSLLKSSFANGMVVPVDCPGIPLATMAALLELHMAKQGEITLLKHGRRLEPLIGVYRTDFHKKIYPVIQFGAAPVFRALDKGHITTCLMDEETVGILNLNTKDAYIKWMAEREAKRLRLKESE